MNGRGSKILLEAAAIIESGAEALRSACSIPAGSEAKGFVRDGRRWDTSEDYAVWAREKGVAGKLRAMAKA